VFRGSKVAGDMGHTAKKLEENMEFLDLGDDDDEDDGPIFTPELAKLKAEAAGKKHEMDDDEMEDNLSEGEEPMDKDNFA
jgi:hypothetical protein